MEPIMRMRILERSAAEYLPEERTVPALWDAAQHCKGCDLYKGNVRAVLGEGPRKARLMFVGEQPGDQEERLGHPFVGPAGKIFDEALNDVGLDRSQTYVTNAVKHFKHVIRGKRRLHAKPTVLEVKACRPWLETEIEIVQPRLLVCLGATAAQALLGASFRVTKQRGQPAASEWAPWTMATIHPSAILRAQSSEERHEMYDGFVRDLRLVARQLKKAG